MGLSIASYDCRDYVEGFATDALHDTLFFTGCVVKVE
jgi:hypothetical protein